MTQIGKHWLKPCLGPELSSISLLNFTSCKYSHKCINAIRTNAIVINVTKPFELCDDISPAFLFFSKYETKKKNKLRNGDNRKFLYRLWTAVLKGVNFSKVLMIIVSYRKNKIRHHEPSCKIKWILLKRIIP